MEIILQMLIGLVAFIALSGGMNLLLKGAGNFLPETVATPIMLDNLFRFMAGIFFSLGFLLGWVVFYISSFQELNYFIGLVVVFAGLGRFYSRMKLGNAGANTDAMMLFEIVLGIIIMFVQYFR